MAELSPAALAVMRAAAASYWDPEEDYEVASPAAIAAAALRAAADQVVPEPNDTDKALLSLAAIRNHCKMRDRLLAIAAELEGHQ